MQHINKVVALEAVAAAWNQAGINYAVAHGIEGYPATVGRDLDVLVRADQVATGLAIAEHVLKAQGFTVVRPAPLWGARLLAVHNAVWDSALEIHTLTHLSWRNVMLADAPRPSEYQGPFQVDPWVSFSKRILLPLLSGGIRRYAERPRDWALYRGEHDVVPPALRSLYGAELAQRLYQALVAGDHSLAAPLLPALRRTCMKSAWINAPATSLRLLGNAVRRKVLRPFASCAPIVALVGPDAVGKSAVLQSVANGNLSIFNKVVVCNLRPNVLPRLTSLDRALTLVSGADSLFAPCRVAGCFHWLRLCYYLLDYAIGHIRDLNESSHQRLVLYDGYALNIIVDPAGFGLLEAHSTWPLKRFTPKPDVVVLLYDTIERIRAYKPELTPSDTQQQLQRWLRLADEVKVDTAISTDAPLEQVSEQIKVLIIKALIAKNGGPTLVGDVKLGSTDYREQRLRA